MRKKFTMLLASLLCCVGVMKAQPVAYTVDATTGDGDKGGFFMTWTYKTSEANPAELKLTVANNNMKVDNNQLQLWVGSGSTYTLSVPSVYKIVSYSFGFVKAGEYSDNVNVIVGDKTLNPTADVQKIEVDNVNSASTYFQMNGANKGIIVTDFVVNIDYADVVGERKSTFAEGDEMYIYSTCRVNGNQDFTGFFTNNNNRATLIQEKPADLVTYGDDPIWIVASLKEMQTEGEAPQTYYEVTLKNKATGKFLGIGGVTSNETVGDPQTFYISQWNNAVFPNGGQKAGTDVWTEDESGKALQQSQIKDTDPIWAVAAKTGKCFNTNGRGYVGDKDVAYPIAFYTVQNGRGMVTEKVNEAKSLIASANSLLASVGISETPVALQTTDETAAGYIKCSNLDPDEGNDMQFLIDNNPSTFIHSNWHSVSKTNDWLDVYLGEGNGLSLFYFTELTRAAVANDYPKTVEIQGSTDGNTYHTVAVVDGLPQSGGQNYSSPLISCDPSYVYLRFVVTTGTNRIYFHMAEFDLYAVSSTESTSRLPLYWGLYRKVEEARLAVNSVSLSGMNAAVRSMTELLTEISVTYPFEITTDDNAPICYAINSGRGTDYWYTYDAEDGKIKLEPLTYANTQYWYFKEVLKNNKVYLQLYPLAGEGKAMSYNDTNDGAGKVVAKVVGTEGYRSNWLLEVSNGVYGLQTENKENRLSNYGGATNKMGFYREKTPDGDSGTAFTWTRKITGEFYRFTCVAPKTGNNGNANYNTLTYNGENHLVTALPDSENINQVFYAEPTGEGNTFYLYVPGANKYLKKIGVGTYRSELVESKDDACKIELVSYALGGQYKLHNSEGSTEHCLYAENHPTETIPYACSGWDEGANSPSAWTMVEVSTFDVVSLLDAAISDALGYMPYFEQGRYTSTMDNVAGELAVLMSWDAEGKTLQEIMAKIAKVEEIIASFEIQYPEPGFYYFYNAGKYLSDDRKSDGETQRVLTDGQSGKNVFYYDGTTIIGYASGYGFEDSVCNTKNPSEMNRFEFGLAYEIGCFTVKSYAGTSDGGHADNCYWENNNGELARTEDASAASGWNLIEVQSLPVTVGEKLHATFFAPVAVAIPDGVKAYTGVVNGEWLTLTEVERVIPAETAVVLIAEKAKTYEFAITESDAPAPAVESHLRGTTPTKVNDRKDANHYYTLQSHDTKGVAFKKFTGATLGGFKAYLEVPAGNNATALRIRFAGEDATGIESVELGEELVIYDLAGRRVQKMEKGIYIVNGKKVVIK